MKVIIFSFVDEVLERCSLNMMVILDNIFGCNQSNLQHVTM